MILEAELGRWLLAMLRPAGMILTAPLFSAAGFPVTLRALLAMAMARFTRDFYSTFLIDFTALPALLALITQELLIGIMIGFLLQIGFSAATLAGELVANMMGLGFAASTDPVAGQNTAILGQFFSMLLILEFLGMNGHLLVFQSLAQSFIALPPRVAGLSNSQIADLIHFGGYLFGHGVLLAFPVGIYLFSLNLIMTALSRLAPQLNLFSIGIPVTVFAGSIVLLISLPVLSDLLGTIINESFDEVDMIMSGLAP